MLISKVEIGDHMQLHCWGWEAELSLLCLKELRFWGLTGDSNHQFSINSQKTRLLPDSVKISQLTATLRKIRRHGNCSRHEVKSEPWAIPVLWKAGFAGMFLCLFCGKGPRSWPG